MRLMSCERLWPVLRPAWMLVVVSLMLVLATPASGHGGRPRWAEITLRNGDVIRGEIVEETADSMLFRHSELGVLTLQADKVISYRERDSEPVVVPSGRPSANSAAVAADAATNEPAEKPISPDDPRPENDDGTKPGFWTSYVALAFSGSYNVNDEVSVRAAGGAAYQSEGFRFTFDGEYYFRVLNDVNVDNNLLLSALQEWSLGKSPWIIFAQEQYQYDEFQSWEHRISLYAGPGYRLIDTDDMTLTLRAGLGATYEVGVSDWQPQALLAQDFMWKFSKRQRVTVNTSIAPNLEDVSDYLIQGSAEYALLLDDTGKGLALTAGVRDIYDSRPPAGSTHNDLRIFGGLRYDF